jgi:hypothetical protein
MARQLDTFPTGGRGRRYEHLDEWLNGGVWELNQGEDFDKPRALRSALGAAARRRGQRVRTRLSGIEGEQVLVVQAVAPQEAAMKPPPDKPKGK